MRLRKIIQDYFTFSRKERNGIILLLLVVICFAIANQLIFVFEKSEKSDAYSFLKEVAEFERRQNPIGQPTSLFFFNPNTIDSLALDSLPIPISIKRNILKFRKKGGRFFKPEDVRKIYGMNDSVFSEIKKYIRIETSEKAQEKNEPEKREITWFKFASDTCTESDWLNFGLSRKQAQVIVRYKNAIGGFKSKEQFAKIYGIESSLMDSLLKYIEIAVPQEVAKPKVYSAERRVVELNSADTVALKSLPGIGSVLSRRIIKYRDLLGGFYSAKQLLEVYGLSPECFQKAESLLALDTLKIKKLDVNFSSAEELAAHPYIGKKLGREIVTFRSKKGLIPDPAVLLEKKVLEKQQFEKIRPYLGTKIE